MTYWRECWPVVEEIWRVACRRGPSQAERVWASGIRCAAKENHLASIRGEVECQIAMLRGRRLMNRQDGGVAQLLVRAAAPVEAAPMRAYPLKRSRHARKRLGCTLRQVAGALHAFVNRNCRGCVDPRGRGEPHQHIPRTIDRWQRGWHRDRAYRPMRAWNQRGGTGIRCNGHGRRRRGAQRVRMRRAGACWHGGESRRD